jgi:hypothetical protein
MAQTFYPDNEAMTDAEKKELEQVLECIRVLRRESGWGLISIDFKGGDMNEIITSIKKKPKYASPS